ncbi:hypothetical protein J1605_003607 [Eschrichtius robustus]|uniref:Uncharacterized protein n=1 Tax=Eschrichtius robustus TaxID=9764 RepID=A0AB34HQ62_ESCRO|nr:hypothetical protein J1605_003607 [Eschrichtius robustus]
MPDHRGGPRRLHPRRARGAEPDGAAGLRGGRDRLRLHPHRAGPDGGRQVVQEQRRGCLRLRPHADRAGGAAVRRQCRQCHVGGREGRPGAEGGAALRGDPAGLCAELHVQVPE